MGIQLNGTSGTDVISAVDGSLTVEGLTISGDFNIADKIIHTGDTNTAIRFPSADTISFETAGNQRLDISSSGHLKIGTASAAGGRLYFESTSGAAQYIASGGTNNQDLLIANSAGEKLRITSSGTVNIGGDYTSTTSRLRISSLSYPETTEYLAVFKAGVTNGNRFKNRYIKIRNNYTGSVHGGVPIVWEANADGSNNKAYGAVVTEGDGAIRFLNAAATSEKAIGTDLLSTISEKLRITSDGKIGIGEDDPDGNYLLIRAASTVGTTKGHIMLTGDSATVGQGPQIVFSESGSGSSYAGAYIGHVRQGSNSTGALVFGCRATGGDANTVPTEYLRINSNGTFGINEPNPNHMFHIKGTSADNDPVLAVESSSWVSGRSAALRLSYTDGNAREIRGHYDHGLQFITNNGEAMRIETSGSSYFGLPAITNMQPEAQVNIISHKNMNGDKDAASGYHLVLKNPNNDTGEAVGLGFAITDTASKIGAVIAHKRTAAGSTGELSFYVRHANGSAPTRRLRIGPEGGVAIGSIDNGYANSLLVQAGVYISAYNGDNLITNGSQGGGASTLYIGNQAIQMSSDKRIKKNIVDTTTNVLDKIKQVRVVDFDWDDPSDTASVNRNSRGKWTGCLAQEMVDIFPHVINAPRKEDNSLDYDSDRTWLVDYGHLVPTLIKGMQEQQKQIEELKAEVASLKSS